LAGVIAVSEVGILSYGKKRRTEVNWTGDVNPIFSAVLRFGWFIKKYCV
jgi:hypothetical protein